MRLNDRVAVVTGGARNIGREYCLKLAAEGAYIVSADLRDSDETVKLIEAEGGRAESVICDIGDEQSVVAAMKHVRDTHGRIDVLVNNAALYGDLENGSIEDLSVKIWDHTMTINLRGTFLAIREALPAMKEHGGSIINISSATIFGWGGQPHYVASKAGVIGLTRAAARALGKYKVRVNAVTPGFTLSDASVDRLKQIGSNAMRDQIVNYTSLGRSELPDDLVGTIAFLASDDAAFITGQTINVDGGWMMP